MMPNRSDRKYLCAPSLEPLFHNVVVGIGHWNKAVIELEPGPALEMFAEGLSDVLLIATDSLPIRLYLFLRSGAKNKFQTVYAFFSDLDLIQLRVGSVAF